MAYETSKLYKEAIEKEARTTFIDGQLTLSNDKVIDLDNSVIDQGSFYVTNQCASNDAFSYGSVVAAETSITLKTDIDRYTLYGAKLSPFFNIRLSDGTIERVPLGEFYVNETSRMGRSVLLKAYDKMLNLDEDIETNTTGTAWQLLSFISSKCDVELAQTEINLVDFTNSELLLSVDNARVKTYRELLSFICKVTCSFAVIDRNGRLKICKFGTEPVKVIQARQRTSSKFSDFQTYFSSIKAEFLVGGVLEPFIYEDVGNGLLYNMGSVPIVQGLEEINQTTLQNIFDELVKVIYTPCEISFHGDPSIDLGDMIVNIDRNGNEITSLVTFYKWSYRGGHTLKAVGQNPKMQALMERESKETESIRAELAEKDIPVYTYTNSSDIEFRGSDSTLESSLMSIANLTVAANKDTTCLILASIPIIMSHDGMVELHQFMGGERGDVVEVYCHAGKNIITFVNHFSANANTIYRYTIGARTVAIQSNERIQEAAIKTEENARKAIIEAYESIVSHVRKTEEDIQGVREYINENEDNWINNESPEIPPENDGPVSGEDGDIVGALSPLNGTIVYDIVPVDMTIPTGKILAGTERVILFGQGLSGNVPWDGTITFLEEITGSIDVNVPVVDVFKYNVSFIRSDVDVFDMSSNPLRGGIERVSVNIPAVEVTSMGESVEFVEIVDYNEG